MERYYQPEIETASIEEIYRIQNERLINTVNRVYNAVPYYRDMMDRAGVRPEDIKSRDDLHKLPFTCKDDLRDTYPFGLFAVPMEKVIRLHASSGTTGKQIVVGYTRNDLENWSDICARQLVAVGGTEHDLVHVSYGYGLFTGGLGMHDGAQKLGAITIPVSSGNTQRQITIMRDFGSTILCCTPSYALYLAECIAEMGIDKSELSLKAGIFGAEAWTEEMRRNLEESLGLKAYDIYGLTEIMGPGVAYECSAQTGMHINEDHFIPEVIDPDTGEVLPEGEQGELVFSCISKEAFPILRYRTRDIGILKREKCSCGRTFIKMSKPMGRTDDMLIIRGVNVFPSQIESVLLTKGYPGNYQIIVDRISNQDRLEIIVELSPETFSDKVRNLEQMAGDLREAVRSTLGVGAEIRLVAPKTIERSTGKAVRVIDKRKL
ncbi:MAG: phenylacetate--CoA ligase family protein [Caldicoprobacterales bacterium]